MEDIESTAPAEPLAAVSAEELLPDGEKGPEPPPADETKIKAVLEAIIYVTEEPLTAVPRSLVAARLVELKVPAVPAVVAILAPAAVVTVPATASLLA